jgi:hypothetical protein
MSVIVMVVLLNVALTGRDCLRHSTTRLVFFAVAMAYLVTFFLPAMARRRPLLGARVRMRALPAHGEAATVPRAHGMNRCPSGA